jgi:hypothetical protein
VILAFLELRRYGTRKPKKPRAISSYFLKDFSINHPKLFADKKLLINGVEILKQGD